MKLCLIFYFLILGGVPFCGTLRAAEMAAPADIVIYNAKVLTVSSNFSVAQAIAVRGGRIIAVGKDRQVQALKGPATRLIDAHGTTVMPGLQDGSVNSYAAIMTDTNAPGMTVHSLVEALDYIRQQAAKKPTNAWIIINHAFPTRMKEGRLPTKAELDEAAPKHPVFWDSGALTVLNTRGMAVAKITSLTKVPPDGEIVLDATTHQPTGLLRNAASLVKLPPVHLPTPAQRRDLLKQRYQLYNEQGITAVMEEHTEPEAIDLFRELSRAGELSVRVRCARWIEVGSSPEQNLERLNSFTNVPGKLPYAPSGAGDDWVRIGPLKTRIDGDVLTGTAYLRSPWGIGPTYGNTEPSYRGDVNANTENLTDLFMQAAARGWQLGADCTGDAALDELLNCFQKVQFKSDISQRRFLISKASFQAQENWTRCQELGIVASSEPLVLYRDGASLLKTLGDRRLKNFLAYKTWFDNGLTIGAGSGDEMVNPWLGLWTTISRLSDSGAPLWPEQQISREQAIRLYTINNACVNFDEHNTGSLEVGKLADLIVIDKDLLKCPLGEVRETKVRLTMVGGKIVWEAK